LRRVLPPSSSRGISFEGQGKVIASCGGLDLRVHVRVPFDIKVRAYSIARFSQPGENTFQAKISTRSATSDASFSVFSVFCRILQFHISHSESVPSYAPPHVKLHRAICFCAMPVLDHPGWYSCSSSVVLAQLNCFHSSLRVCESATQASSRQ
jgi:hypothetical protein